MNPVDYRDACEVERCLSFVVMSLVFTAIAVNFLTIFFAILFAI